MVLQRHTHTQRERETCWTALGIDAYAYAYAWAGAGLGRNELSQNVISASIWAFIPLTSAFVTLGTISTAVFAASPGIGLFKNSSTLRKHQQ
jgi:hypothetical protein